MKRTQKLHWLPILAGFLVCLLAVTPAFAEEKPAASIDKGATAWMLAATALVFLMTPGLALFYGGMVRSRNVLGTMMQSIFCMALVSIQWVILGYTIAFGDSSAGGLLGSFKYAFLESVPHDQPFPGTHIPHMVQMAYQMMFAAITPALITGAFAERVRFGAFVLFSLLWTTFVYDPLAHCVWGGGFLSFSEGSWLKQAAGVGVLDFAGGTVVHISCGVSALIFALLVGKRRNYPAQPILANNLTLTVLGAGLLWFGWSGMSGGRALDANEQAGLAFTVTHVAGAAAALSWAAVEWFHRGKVSVLGVLTGLVAGLVCISPASGYVTAMPALFMGLLVSPICYYFITVLKAKLGYDDSLDVFGVHGVGGTVGVLLTGVFCSQFLPAGSKAGLTQFTGQIIAVACTIAYVAVVTAILVLIVDKTMGIRVAGDDELTGLDLTQHGEVGYNL
jgi:Amt family ammonium transporter